MKAKLYFVVATAGIIAIPSGNAVALHSGGVAHCDGTIHGNDRLLGESLSRNMSFLS